MAGRAITKAIQERIRAFDEEPVFARYLEVRSLRKLVRELLPDVSEGSAQMEFYRWLKQDPERWARWQDVKKLRGHSEVDRIAEDVDDITRDNYAAKRVEIGTRQWLAERLNREDYGAPTAQIQVAVGIGNSWLEALRGADSAQPSLSAQPLHDSKVEVKAVTAVERTNESNANDEVTAPDTSLHRARATGDGA